ncbi:MAG: hypothetical protein U9R15_04755 [Chloroflexota bacterium]|nr:hypothetical protein [Chloroflexota bacterium]
MKKSKSPYLSNKSILETAGSALMGSIVFATLYGTLGAIILGVLVYLKLSGIVALSWIQVTIPIWIAMMFIFGIAIITAAMGYLINFGIFIQRLITNKIKW